MSDSVHQSELSISRGQTSAERAGNSINGGLFLLFSIELFMFGIVVGFYLIHRYSYPNSVANFADLVWGLITLAAAGWGTWFLIQSRNAVRKWDLDYFRNLLVIVVSSGGVLIGILVLHIASSFVSSPVYMDVRSQFNVAPAASSGPTPAGAAFSGDAANGKKWFGMSCVTCHGPTGDGVLNAAPSLRASDFLGSSDDQAIASLIRNGRAADDPANKTGKVMPAKGGNPFLDESKIADLVAFLKDLDQQLGQSSSTSATNLSTDFDSIQNRLGNQVAPIVKKWTLEDLTGLSISTDEESLSSGMQAFVKADCHKCHVAEVAEQKLGPTLDQVVKKYSREKLLQHIVDPSAEINEDFQSHSFLLLDGQTVTGVVVRKSDQKIELITDLLKPEELTVISMDDIDEQEKSKVSAMPTGLVDVLTESEIAGLIAYVDAVGNQMAALNAPQLNRWVVPAAESEHLTTALATSSAVPAKPFFLISDFESSTRYTSTFSWLFIAASSILALHFLWVIGAASAIVLHRELQLDTTAQIRLAHQTFLFWSIGIVWLGLWFLLFFLMK